MTRSNPLAWGALMVVPAIAALVYLWASHSPFVMSGLLTLVAVAILTPVALWLLPAQYALPAIDVPRPRRESAVLLTYVLLWALLFIGWFLYALPAYIPDGRERFVVKLLLKLLTMVVLPSAALIAAGGAVRDHWRGRFDLRRFWLPLVVLGSAVVAGAFADPTAARPSNIPPAQFWFIAPLTFLWIGIEAGLCEEYLFRACLQTRLAAWLKSDVAAVSLTALIFGLIHFPGFAFHQPPPGAPGGFNLETLSYCLVSVAPMGVLFGVIWVRTRNLWLCVAIHALADIPLMAVMKTVWFS